jgi:hypothetical protein
MGLGKINVAGEPSPCPDAGGVLDLGPSFLTWDEVDGVSIPGACSTISSLTTSYISSMTLSSLDNAESIRSSPSCDANCLSRYFAGAGLGCFGQTVISENLCFRQKVDPQVLYQHGC